VTGNYPITFVSAVNNREILENNLLASPCLRHPHPHQILIQEGYSSAAKAYNDAIDKSENDLLVFAHQDIILPQPWVSDLERGLEYLDQDDPEWGVIGSYGVPQNDWGRGYIYSSGLGVMGEQFERPVRVQTLDEIVLIFRKSSGLRFDDSLPHFHMYGADICMAAQQAGRKNYAISAFCIHNTQPSLILGEDFYRCCQHVRRRWKKLLPIQTTCVRITRLNFPMYRRRLGELYVRYVRPKEFGGARTANVQQLLSEVDALLKQSCARRASSTEAVR
jgi:Glycosyltransferase like family